MTMLDGLAAAGHQPPAPGTSMMSTNRALRSARDAVDSHQVWDLDPESIEDGRIADRLDPDDVADLRDAIDTNGQTVPILVRRHPTTPDRYMLVYGRRRLQAVRDSDKVQTVRALIASMGEDAAVRAQISENMARRDLSFIERALFAQELVEPGIGNHTEAPRHDPPPLALVLETCKEIQTFSQHWDDLIRLSDTVWPMMGIASSVWSEAQRRMGQAQAAATVAVMLERFSEIKSPSAYLRALGQKAERGVFTCGAMIRAFKSRTA